MRSTYFLFFLFLAHTAHAAGGWRHEAAAVIKRHEGWRSHIYRDSAGFPTIGWGFNLNSPLVRRNLPADVVGGARALTRDEAAPCFAELFKIAERDARDFAGPAWRNMSPAQKIALVDLAYNLGRPKLFQFKRMRAAVRRRDWPRAAAELLDSKYARQVGRRARENANLLKKEVQP